MTAFLQEIKPRILPRIRRNLEFLHTFWSYICPCSNRLMRPFFSTGDRRGELSPSSTTLTSTPETELWWSSFVLLD
ncbi:MAG: hypothetical protein V7L27_20465 [Nostoc sp.]|uniref:hypothetical protein n=1 Tax=Nostoc sp. TaxID=1180 RepID=UPI002FF9B392